MKLTREQVLRYRWRRQGLDREPGTVRAADLDVLDLGVQSGAQESARLSFLDRGVSVEESVAVTSEVHDDLALVWAVRGAPHYYRREDLPDVATALSPFDTEDAYRRLAGSGAAWKKAAVDPRRALEEMGVGIRDRVERPAVKGVVSGDMHGAIPPEYEVDCRPCGVTHPAEMPFRLAPLFAGVELEPGTSPPVLRRVPGWPENRPVGPATDPDAVPDRLHVVRAYLRFLGPATPTDVAAYLDSTPRIVREHWPADAVEVDRAGTRAWILPGDVDAMEAAGEPGKKSVRLLAPFDLFTAAKDRVLLVDKARHRTLWPVLGRPGAVALHGEILGTWRPVTKGKKLSVRLSVWNDVDDVVRREIERRADLLAACRDRTFAGLIDE